MKHANTYSVSSVATKRVIHEQKVTSLPGLKFSLKLLTLASGAGLFSAGAKLPAEVGA